FLEYGGRETSGERWQWLGTEIRPVQRQGVVETDVDKDPGVATKWRFEAVSEVAMRLVGITAAVDQSVQANAGTKLWPELLSIEPALDDIAQNLASGRRMTSVGQPEVGQQIHDALSRPRLARTVLPSVRIKE